MNKIILTGPESAGKTTLARDLAARYHTAWAPEYARDYLRDLGRPYAEDDLVAIARGQLAREEAYARQSSGLLFCDTSLLVIKVWSDYRYGRTHPWILEQLRERPAQLYLLCRPDLPWEPDPLRENPNDREALFDIYQRELEALSLPYAVVSGKGQERLQNAALEIERKFGLRDGGDVAMA